MTTVKKSKKLTLDLLAKDADSYDKLKKIKLSGGFFTEIYTNFSNVKMDEMLASMSEFITEYQQKVGTITDAKTQDYINIHILLFFTTLTGKSDFTFDEKLVITEKLLKTDAAEEIFDAFNKEDIAKVYARVFKKLETMQELVKNNEDMKNELIKQVEGMDIPNKDIILKTMLGVETGDSVKIGDENGDIQES